MIEDLNRLKGTTDLVAGFDRFLATWIANEPNGTHIDWTAPEWQYAARLPLHVRSFYDVVQRWPTSRIFIDNNQDHLHFPPLPRSGAADADSITIASENQGNWTIWSSHQEQANHRLFTNADLELNRVESLAMETPIDEFLVTFGMHELIANGEHVHRPDATMMAESHEVFAGRYAADSPLRVNWHPDGYLWFEQEFGTELFVWCSRRTPTRDKQT